MYIETLECIGNATMCSENKQMQKKPSFYNTLSVSCINCQNTHFKHLTTEDINE